MAKRADVLVVGAGAAGLSAGIALARKGFAVTVAGELEARQTARTVALFDASLGFYESLGLLSDIDALGAPLKIMRIIDDTGSLFSLPQQDFVAREIGLAAFGINIENHLLTALLAERARQTPGLTFVESRLADFQFSGTEASGRLPSGERLTAHLVVAADGRHSGVRTAAAIEAVEQPYPQTALTALLGHDRPHRNVSTEFHTRAGPFTLVPLRSDPGEAHRSSLVWMMAPSDAERLAALPAADIARTIERQAHSIFGKMRLSGPCGLVPMGLMTAGRIVGERVVLIGDAAHAFPPIGAQGLNLGLRDIGHLVEALGDAADPGCPPVLEDYAQRRQADIRLRTTSVDLLNRSLLSQFPPVDFLRGAGLLALSGIGPLRRAIMREGVSPAGHTPRMMQRDPQRANKL